MAVVSVSVSACGLLAARKSLSSDPCRAPETRIRRVRAVYLFEEPGGNFLNIFSTPLSRFLMFLSELLERVSLSEPLQISCLVLVSKRSTTTVPTLYVSVVVVASPKPPPPKRRQPQPPPKPS